MALAKRVGGPSHGFMAVQLPVNARADEAATQKWQPLAVDKSSKLYPPPAPPPPPAPASKPGRRLLESGGGSGGAAAGGGVSGRQLLQAAGGAAGGGAAAAGDGKVVVQATLLEVARELGVLVFASAPFAEVRRREAVPCAAIAVARACFDCAGAGAAATCCLPATRSTAPSPAPTMAH